jgi:hypothetical protein
MRKYDFDGVTALPVDGFLKRLYSGDDSTPQ